MMRIDKQKTTLTIAHAGVREVLLLAALAFWLLAGVVVVNAVGAEPSLTDKAITNEVETEFIFDSAVPENGIDVTTDDGIVTLTGTVSDLLAKNRAGEIAETIRGV
ncbi:MAG: BON domain-containing protein, partial [bacterium]